MLEFFGEAMGAILSGGATGLLGSVLSIWGEHQKQKEMFRHTEKMAEITAANMRLEAELHLKQIQVEGAVKIDEIESRAFSESFAMDKATYYTGPLGAVARGFMVLVDVIRGLIRPLMTIYLMALTTLIYIEVRAILGGIEGGMSGEGAAMLLSQIIMVILYLTSTVVLWWFGTRQKVIKGTG